MIPRQFKIKICGVTTAEDAVAVAQAGADAIGLNFYPRSKRYVTLEQATRIAANIPAEVVKVGVFVNPTRDELKAAIEAASLEWVQLHGDESPEYVAQLRNMAVVKAFRWDGSGRAIEEFFERHRSHGGMPRCILIDAPCANEYGGTGVSADWTSIGQWWSQRPKIPLILAGGLSPQNVAVAMRESRVDLVDCASGVEASPGRKDPILVAEFVRTVMQSRRSMG
ncbi:MAG: phosphoribosylanthranilate isomerase [Pirellulales bacterium]|nr:phosphoribosylanthranilate isomerase [Pirellulales bacterium]